METLFSQCRQQTLQLIYFPVPARPAPTLTFHYISSENFSSFLEAKNEHISASRHALALLAGNLKHTYIYIYICVL